MVKESGEDEADADSPNPDAVKSALSWLAVLRKQAPPPTCIVPEPAGGIIVEWRSGSRGLILELTFYNTGKAEWTEFVGGKVVNMKAIPSRVK